jgi:hypothetical protein
MRHRPHSRWRSAIGSVWPDLVGRSRASVKEADRPTTLLGFVMTLRSLVPASQVSFRSSRSLEPRLSFHERPPRVYFLYGGSIAKSASGFLLSATDQGRPFRLPGFATTLPQARSMTDLRDRIAHAALGFSCFRFPGRRDRRVFRAFDGSPRLVSRCRAFVRARLSARGFSTIR